MNRAQLLDTIARKAGVAADVLDRATEIVVRELDAWLRPWARAEVERILPPSLTKRLGQTPPQAAVELDAVYVRVAEACDIRLGAAIEVVQAVLVEIGRALGSDTRVKLAKELSDEWSARLEDPHVAEVPLHGAPVSQRATDDTSLAGGRPHSRNPVAGAVPSDHAQSNSIAASDDPRGDRKISPSTDRGGSSLGDGRIEPRRRD